MEATDTATASHPAEGWANPAIYRDDSGQCVATCGACGHQTTGTWPKDAADAMASHIAEAVR